MAPEVEADKIVQKAAKLAKFYVSQSLFLFVMCCWAMAVEINLNLTTLVHN